MTRLPIINYATMNKALNRLEFNAVRQKGSHVFYRHSDGRTTSVPNHPNRDLARPLVHQILREINISPDEFLKILKK